jgi:hypothetical protein
MQAESSSANVNRSVGRFQFNPALACPQRAAQRILRYAFD